MRVLVCGGRDYGDRASLFAMMDCLHQRHTITAVVHGAQIGADTLGGDWAKSVGIEAIPFHADWTGYGSEAGPIRNTRMLADGKPDMAVVCPGGHGTVDMVRKLRKARVPIVQVASMQLLLLSACAQAD